MVGIAKWQIIGIGGAGTHSGKPNTPSDPPRPCCLLTGYCCLSGSPDIQLKGTLPLEHLVVDFTEMKPHGMYVLEMDKSFSYLE